MQFKASLVSLYLFLAFFFPGCASKKRVDEMAVEIKNNHSEINQLKIDQQKTLECATKIAFDAKSLVEIVGKIKNEVSENKKQLDDHGLRINELLKELSTIKSATQNNNTNPIAKALILKGVTLPDGTFIPNDDLKPAKTSLKAEKKSEVENAKPHVPTSLERVLNPANYTSEYQERYRRSPTIEVIDWFRRMLPIGTTQDRVFQVMGKPDQINFSGAWVYDGIVQRVDDWSKTTYLKITFSDNGDIASVE
jgi:outer membrane murein-binding lipoprotein Lpp